MKKKDQLMEQRLLTKYQNLEFNDYDDGLRWKIIPDNMDYLKRKGWHVLACPSHYKGDGSDDDLLEAHQIDGGLIATIRKYEQPAHLNIKFILPKSN